MNSTCCNRHEIPLSRRQYLAKAGLGLGAMALGTLLDRDGLSADGAQDINRRDPLAPRPSHFAAQGKAVISLFMQGGPSQVDTFDPKPMLARFDGQPLPDSFKSDDLKLQFMSAAGATLMASPFPFRKRGQSGLEISDLFPKLAEHADDLALVRSCYHESFIHGPALSLMHTGSMLLGHPSVGSWVVYGLGSESDSLPAFMVMADGAMRGSNSTFSSGFLPAVYQGTLIRTEGAPIRNLSRPAQVAADEQRALLDQIGAWNSEHLEARQDDSNLAARIANYELAFRMQSAAPDLIDLAGESPHTMALYGADREPTAQFGRMCLSGAADGRARRPLRRAVLYRLGRSCRLPGEPSRQRRSN